MKHQGASKARRIGFLLFVFAVAATLASAPVRANICRAEQLTCVTTMPVGGYCECTAHGQTEGGEVVSKPEPGHPVNATSGGCGAQPNAPGCRRTD